MSRELPQVNIRLSEDENAVLEAAAWVKKCGKKDLAREALQPVIARYAKQEAVQTAIKARQIEEASSQAEVAQISSRRSERSAKKDGA